MNEISPGASFRFTSRGVALVLLILIAGAAALRWLDAEQPAAAALKVVWAALAVGIVPGALVTLLWRPRAELTLLELIGFGVAFSFGLVHLATVLAVTAHVSAVTILVILAIASALMAGRLVQRRPVVNLVVTADESIVVVLLVLLGVFLYLQGAPTDSFEDQVHVAIARRLAYLQHPRLDNLYFAPTIVYTYPFPGTHYFIGLIARAGDIDALFLYHKLRFFWGPAAIVMLYLAARAVFGTRAVACGVAVTAIVLAGTGVFGMAEGFPWGWGQLVPHSHVSDVAMTVIFPGLLVLAFEGLQAVTSRERLFFFTGVAIMAFMLTVVHVREVVQFAAYLGCFLVVTAASRECRPYLRRTAVMLAITLAIAVLFALWQRQEVLHITDLVSEERAKLLSITREASWRTLIFTPASELLSSFILSFGSVFTGLTPFFLFAGPAVIVLYRRRPLVWLMSSTTLAYLLVMSVPVLAIPYMLATYYEILITPVRNVIFFVYLVAGALIYTAVVALTRVDRTRVAPLLAGAAAGLLALLASLCLNHSERGFFLPLIAAYGLTFFFIGRGEPARRISRVRIVAVAAIGVIALAALLPDHAPARPAARVNVRWKAALSAAQRVSLEQRLSLTDGQATPDRTEEVNVWSYTLNDISVDSVRALVQHPDVVDTFHVDRSTFTVEQQPPRTAAPIVGVERVSWLQYPGLMLSGVTTVLVWALGLLLPATLAWSRSDAASSLDVALREPFYRRIVPYALFMIPFAIWSARPTQSPLALVPMRPFGRAATPREMMNQTPCVTFHDVAAPFTDDVLGGGGFPLPDRSSCAPDYAVMAWVQAHVPADAVFAMNRWNPYLPSVYVPQQVVAFPSSEKAFVNERDLLKDYYKFFDERVRKYRMQPFFNSLETPAERTAFVKALGVTHVLVDPAYYEEMRGALDPLTGEFELKYGDGRWAVYEVRQKTTG